MRWTDLFESRVAHLYHFTGYAASQYILNDGEFRARIDFICTTRDKTLKFYNNPIRFTLDWVALKKRYRISPYSFMHIGRGMQESEERIMAMSVPISYALAVTLTARPTKAAEWDAGDVVAALAAERGLMVMDERGERPDFSRLVSA